MAQNGTEAIRAFWLYERDCELSDVPIAVEKMIVAIDPGVTTGYSIAFVSKDRILIDTKQEVLNQWDFYETMTSLKPNLFICEDFAYRNRARAGLELFSVQLIGIINLVSHYCDVPITMQKPSVVGGFFKDKTKLIERGLYKKNHVHAMDSLRHLLHWFEFAGGYPDWNQKPYELEA